MRQIKTLQRIACTLTLALVAVLAVSVLELSKQVQRLVMVDFPRTLPTQTLTWP